ncbi:putrescine-binding periplasmic protein precursor [Yersinia pestis biovar Microtus str. 91001]|uniref:Putrescine-binding periplasmic protein n=19 Tax=Yersinia pseudotuberculosis complex TaxID=1649845 RepID=Q8D032_YERPE|nr:periplasmic putrescine-binding protein of putrescine ABC transporter [Yersinia pestis KIM10+]AAS61505.1 putrescine-binding periplasmic protein precursor [Yersinia pestis biovar Microtus str. 91001]
MHSHASVLGDDGARKATALYLIRYTFNALFYPLFWRSLRMFTQRKKWLSGVAAGLLMAASVSASAEEKILHIYNWSDYIAPDTLANFQKETGIKVVYDVFDSNEVLEGKLMAGSTGFDLVVPSASFLERQLSAGVFKPLDKSKLPNEKNLDPELLALVSKHDPDNKYAIPYLWATTGIGYNVEKVKAVLGEDAPVNSWDLVLKPENLEKLKSCGVSFLDAPSEIFATVLNYLGKDPNSTLTADYTGSATDLLLKLRPNIRYFHSSQYINDLANGDICVAVGWAGDIMQASNRAKEAKNGVNVAYSIPKEGALAFFDVFAMPTDAKNQDEAYQFLNYLMRPDVIANISNHVFYANANQAATPLVNAEVRDNPGIYPPADVRAKMFTLKVQDPKIDRVITRAWTKVKSGK